MESFIRIKNAQAVDIKSVPVLPYADFLKQNGELPADERYHCVSYFGHPTGKQLQLICCMAEDTNGDIFISSCKIDPDAKDLPSLTAIHESFHMFEREIAENFGITYADHPWLKPVRYAHNRANKEELMNQYPFYQIKGEELHEVGVGPIHAGIIEPGYFRFICNGEKILHLEIQLGYQHRGIEQLFVNQKHLNQRIQLSESIAGDSTIAHGSAFALIWESLCHYQTIHELLWVQTVALEIERIAMHTADLSAMCGDIAYQLGNSVYGRLRTPIINFFQAWCGNRFARTLIRPSSLWHPFTDSLAAQLSHVLADFERDFTQMGKSLLNMPSALSRFEKTGVVSREQAVKIGTVGMAARTSGVARDIRSSHPDEIYQTLDHQPITYQSGDVMARTKLRHEEVLQSLRYLHTLLRQKLPNEEIEHATLPVPNMLSVVLVEGWRGEICHCGITGKNGELIQYKITDPSFHNWMALALAVRDNAISDFPICNKSFNLSYCGFDL